MKSRFFLLLICCAFIIYGKAQVTPPGIEWQKSLGGTKSDGATSIQQTLDGGYIVAGSTTSTNGDVRGNHGYNDIWIVKLDNAGTIDWKNTLGGSDNDYASAIQQTKDGGYIVAGYSSSNDGDVSGLHGISSGFPDYWIVKLNKVGVIQWQKALGGAGVDKASSIQQTTDGGYIIAGWTSSSWSTPTDGDVSGNHGYYDYWIVKLNSSGTIQWQKCYGGLGDDEGKSILQTKDGGYIVAGYSTSNDGDVSSNYPGYNYWILKLDNTGAIQWQKSYGGSTSDEANSILQTIDGGYVVAGYSYSNDGDVVGHHGNTTFPDYWVVKLDSIGVIQWQQSLGGSNPDYGYKIMQTIDGGYIVAGTSVSFDGDVTGNHISNDAWIVKLNSSGTIQWQQSLGGTYDDGALSIQQTTDGGYIIGGASTSNDGDVSGHHGSPGFFYPDYWVVKLKPDNVLPLIITQFSVQALLNKMVLVSWSIDKEINNKYFTIEKSKDGIHFIEAGVVSANNASRPNCSFTDHTPFTGTSYYRLKQTDINDAILYSNIIAVKIATGNTYIHILPNPSHNGIFAADLGEVKENVFITVTDNTGRKVYTQEVASVQQLSIRLSNQPKGIYHLHVRYNNGSETAKLVIE